MTIKIENISLSYGDLPVLKDLDLSIPDGSFFTLLGPSGCGKTSTLRLIAGLADCQQGEIWIDDRCVFSSRRRLFVPPEDRHLGMVFQSYALWPHMTVLKNVMYGPRMQRKSRSKAKDIAMEALATVQLKEYSHRYPHELSGGQQQRVALARAVACEPKALLFDEPLSNLDARLRDEMRIELRQLHKKFGLTSVYVTHDQEEATVLSDLIAVMKDGVILQIGSPREVYEHPNSVDIAGFLGAFNVWSCDGSPNGKVSALGGRLQLSLPEGSQPGQIFKVCVRPQDIVLTAGSDASPAAGVTIEGTVKTRYYAGPYCDYEVAVGSDTVMVRRDDAADTYEPGNVVRLSIPASKTRVLPQSPS